MGCKIVAFVTLFTDSSYYNICTFLVPYLKYAVFFLKKKAFENSKLPRPNIRVLIFNVELVLKGKEGGNRKKPTKFVAVING